MSIAWRACLSLLLEVDIHNALIVGLSLVVEVLQVLVGGIDLCDGCSILLVSSLLCGLSLGKSVVEGLVNSREVEPWTQR